MKELKNPMVSVIMGVYNQYDEAQLLSAVNSILTQTFRDFEFIIYDDGSDEEPAGYLKKLATQDERIRIVRCEENHGLAFSLNRCINVARGKYLARMDADDISLPSRIEEEVNFLEKHEEYDWVGCNAKVFDGRTIWGSRKMAEMPNQYNFLPFSPYIHPAVMFRRNLFEEGSHYNVSKETLRCEDYELFMRLYQQGYRGYNIQKTLFLYREGVDAYKRRTWKSRIREMSVREKNFKHMDLPLGKRVMYTLRPVITIMIPYPMIARYKKIRMERLSHDDSRKEETDVFVYFKRHAETV